MDKVQKESLPRICIANTRSRSHVEDKFLYDNSLAALSHLGLHMIVIVGNYKGPSVKDAEIVSISSPQFFGGDSLVIRIMDSLEAQFRIIQELIRRRYRFDVVIFGIGEYRNLLSMLFTKLVLRKFTIVYHRSTNAFLEAKIEYQRGIKKLVPYIQEAMLRAFYALVDKILVLSPRIAAQGGLDRYRAKIGYYRGYVDSQKFALGKLPSQKPNLVGYIGRLSHKKGVVKLVKAMPLVLSKVPDCRLLIAGKGDAEDEMLEEIKRHQLGEKVMMIPWIAEEDYPKVLSSLKMFVLPSLEEGVPKAILEAMACGVVVAATPVGGIPDIVQDGCTGFTIRDSEPKEIAKTILRGLAHPSLDHISLQARRMVEDQYSIGPVSNNMKKVLLSATLPDKIASKINTLLSQ